MIRAIALVSVEKGADAEATAAALRARAARAGVRASQLGTNLRGSLGGGRFTWDLALDDAAALALLLAPLERARSDAIAFRPRETHVPGAARRAGVRRTLLLRVRPGADPARVAGFEHALLDMPGHIAAIRSWALHRTDPGLWPTRFTHVWEQEYDDVAGLERDYMSHPYHWGLVDAFFDPECPQHVTEAELAHVYYAAESSVLAWDLR